MVDLTVDDLLGRVFVRCADQQPVEGYFTCVSLIRPLFTIKEFISSTPGFYINVSGNSNEVRLSYFTNNKSVTPMIIKNFLNQHNDLCLMKSSEPQTTNISKGYGGDELRFRKFLHTYTQVGLDLLNYDVLFARKLVAEYRMTFSPQKISCRPLFEPIFKKQSIFYNQLEQSSIDQLWRDLDFWHPITNSEYIADWAHFLVNMLLPGDLIYIRPFEKFFLNPTPIPPIKGELKRKMLKIVHLEMPDD